MAKKKVSQVNKKVDEDTQKEMLEVSRKIQEILESSGYALQPYHDPRDYEIGIIPRVRLVKVTKDNPETNVEQGTDTEEAIPAEDTDTTTEPESA